MISKHRKIWRCLLALAVGLWSLKFFVPLSGLLEGIFSGVFFAIMLTYSGVGLWEERRERQADQSGSAAASSGDQT
jgi:hypothetical protein